MFHTLFKDKYLSDKRLPFCLLHQNYQTDYKLHTHEFSEIVIVYHGSGEHLIFDERYRIKTGDVFLIRNQVPHGYANCKELALYNILFDMREVNNPLQAFCHYPAVTSFFQLAPTPDKKDLLNLTHEELQDVLNLIHVIESEQSKSNEYFTLSMAAYFILLMVKLVRYYSVHKLPQNKKSSLIISELLNQLAEHPERHWSRTDMANSVNVSERTLTRMFKDCTGYAPSEYLIALRIKKGAMLLLNTEESLEMIAEQTGFVDSNYFCRQFKQHFGVSPQKYRMGEKQTH